MAFLFKHPKSQYWFAGFLDRDGKRRNRSTRSTTRREAQRIADAYEEAARKHRTSRQVREVITTLHESITGEELASISIANFIDSWIERKEPETAQSTLACYKGAANKFLDFLGDAGDREICEITPKQILEFRNQQAKKLAAKTVNRDVKCLKMVFRAARREGLITDDPTEFLDPVRDTGKPTVERRPFSIAELDAIMEAANDEWKSMIMIGLYTGQRLGDVARLTGKDFDLEGEHVVVVTKKTHKRLMIPLATPLLEYLKSVGLPKDPTAPVHPNAHAVVTAQKTTGQLSNQFARIMAKAGLRQKPSHKNTGKGRNARRARSALTFHSLDGRAHV